MSRRGTTIIVGALVVGAALFVAARMAMNDNGAPERAATGTGSFAARTAWGEPNLAGVWKAVPLGASSGRDTFNLAKLEALYTPEARTRMKELSAKDDPTMRCAPPLFPRAAMLGHPVQIIQRQDSHSSSPKRTRSSGSFRRADGRTPRSSTCFQPTWAIRPPDGRTTRSWST